MIGTVKVTSARKQRMPVHRSSLKLLGCYAFLIVGTFVCMGISLGTNYWISIEINTKRVSHAGLFEICFDPKDVCYTFDDVHHIGNKTLKIETGKGLTIPRDMCISSVVIAPLSLLVMGHLAYTVFVKKEILQTRAHGIVSGFFCTVAAILGGAGATFYIADRGQSPYIGYITWTYGYSFALAYIFALFAFGSGLLAFLSSWEMYRQEHSVQPHAQPEVKPATSMHATMPIMHPPGGAPQQQFNTSGTHPMVLQNAADSQQLHGTKPPPNY